MANCDGSCELDAVAEGNIWAGPGVEEREVKRLARFEMRLTPVAWHFGVGFVGYGVDGFLGAGVALMLPATAVFVGALIDDRQGSAILDRQRKKTLRHRYFLWLDQLDRKRDQRRRERRERKQAERAFLERRNRGR